MLGKIRAFNNKARQVGLHDYGFNYKDIMKNVYTKKGFQQQINRMDRFLRPGAERIIKTKTGVEMTVWERNEFIYAQRAVNKNRANLWREDRLRAPSRQGYEPFTRKPGQVVGQTNFQKILQSYFRMGNSDYNVWREDIIRQNLVRSVDWMDVYPELHNEILGIFDNMSRDELLAAMNDPTSPTTVNFNYFKDDGTESMDKYTYAQSVVESWKIEVKVLKNKAKRKKFRVKR